MNSWMSSAVVGVGAAVDDVHQRHRQGQRADAAEVAVQRQLVGGGGGAGARHRHREDRVGAERALGRGAVELAQRRVDRGLIGGVGADQLGRDALDDVGDRLGHALAEEAAGVAVAQLERFVLAGRRARRDDGAAQGAALEADLGLDGGVAARVEDLARVDPDDVGHAAETTRGPWRHQPR
jgi:hypothetical protein